MNIAKKTGPRVCADVDVVFAPPIQSGEPVNRADGSACPLLMPVFPNYQTKKQGFYICIVYSFNAFFPVTGMLGPPVTCPLPDGAGYRQTQV